jgi:Galactose oxidase, central domain
VKTPVAPPVRYMSSKGFDKRSCKLVFGGLYSTGLRRDTWLWDGATSTWTQIQMEPSPPAAAGPMLFSDPHCGGAIMFGGSFL